MPLTSTTATAEASKLRAVHPILPVGFAALALGAAAAFIPSRSELTKRLFQDGEHLRALKAAADNGSVIRAEAAASVEAANASQGKAALDEALTTPLRLAQFAATAEGRALVASGVIAEAKPAVKLAELAKKSANLERSDRELMLRTVAGQAIDQGHPEVAALVYSSLVQSRPETMTEDLLREVVRSWRANSQADQALSCVEAWLKSRGAEAKLPNDLAETRIELFFETDRAGEALDILLEQLQAEQGGSGIVEKTLAEAAEAAGYSGRIAALRPYVVAWISAHPLGKMRLEELCSAVKGDKSLPEHQSFSRFALDLAHWCEWDGQPEEALPLYCKVVVLGAAKHAGTAAVEWEEALNRAQDIAEDCGFTGDFLAVLDVVMKQPNAPAKLGREYGRLLALAGRFDEAAPVYAAWIGAHPLQPDAVAELAAMQEEQGDLSAALVSWQKAAALAPGVAEYLKRAAEVCIDLKSESAALGIYQQFTAEQHDSVTLENFALVAESLGNYAALNRALLMRFDRLQHANTQDFLELARSYELIGEQAPRLQCLRRGVQALPQSRTLRRQLAAALQDSEMDNDVVNLLEIASTKDDLRALSTYIISASQSEQYARARKFLGDDWVKDATLPADVRLHLGHIFYHTGAFSEARSLYASVDSNAATWPLLAEACYQLGSFAEAEKYQRQYVDDCDSPSAEALQLLGDILRNAGKEHEAQLAYDQALEIIRARHGVEAPPTPKVSSSGKP